MKPLNIVQDALCQFGTKELDYIASSIAIVNCFDEPNHFTDYVDLCVDVGFWRNFEIPDIRRSVLIRNGLKHLFPGLACE